MATPRPKSQKLPRANREIDADPIRLVDENGEMMGVVPLSEGLRLATQRGFDLVEISPTAEPPVCKLLDFGKYKFEAQKRAHDERKKQKVVNIKEIKLRPHIEQHDYDVKLKSSIKFINAGDKVKFTLRFRGREITHKEIAFELMERMMKDLADISKPELTPKMDGRQVLMILVPK